MQAKTYMGKRKFLGKLQKQKGPNERLKDPFKDSSSSQTRNPTRPPGKKKNAMTLGTWTIKVSQDDED